MYLPKFVARCFSKRPIAAKYLRLRKLAAAALYALLMLTLGSSLHADAFSDGLEAYEQGEYPAALEYFGTSIAEKETAAARHNLALTYFQLGQPAQAAWQIERSLRLDPINTEYRYKLGALRQQLGLFDNEPEWHEIGALALTSTVWVVIATLSFWILLASVLLPCIYGSSSGIGIKIIRLITVIALILALPAIWLNYRLLQTGIIVSQEPSSLHTAPASAAPENGTVRPAERAHIIDRHNNFYQVKTESGATGWISNQAFRPIQTDME